MARQRYAPLQSDKHEITWSNLSQDAGTSKVNINLITPVQPASKNVSTEVGIGSKVGYLYFEFNLSAQTTGVVKVVHWTVSVTRTGQTQGEPNTYYQPDRSQILKRGMEMLPNSVGTVFKRIFVVKIPKTYQRMRENQTFQLQYKTNTTESLNMCGIVIYKELY